LTCESASFQWGRSASFILVDGDLKPLDGKPAIDYH